MPLVKLLSDFLNGMAKDGNAFLVELNGLIRGLAAQLQINETVLFGVGIGLALIFGFFGYKLIKLVMAILGAFVGYFGGEELFRFLQGKVTFELPEWSIYLCGGIVAVVLMCMAYAKFSYAWFFVAGSVTYAVLLHYWPDNRLCVMICTLVVALWSVMAIKTAFVLADSVLCAALSVSFLSQLLPEVKLLALGIEKSAIYAFAAIAVICALVQFRICYSGAKRRAQIEAEELEYQEEM